jgi:hypothetical protein
MHPRRTFGMHLELSAQRTNFTCPRDFGGLLRPVARLFLVIGGGKGRDTTLFNTRRDDEADARRRSERTRIFLSDPAAYALLVLALIET